MGRKLLIAITAAAIYAVVLVATASAQEHRVRVTLVTGQVMTLTVDVPPGGSVASALPSLPAPVKSIVDLGPIATPTPIPTVVPTPTVPSVPTPGSSPTPSPSPSQHSGGGGSSGGGNGAQSTPTPSGGGSSQSGHSRTRARGGNSSSGSGVVGKVRGKARKLTRKVRRHHKAKVSPNAITRPDGVPTLNNPTVSLATPGPAAIGVPNFFIDKFRIPPFLLPIYQAAGIQYGVRWEVLAAINEIETDYGRNLNISSAGAVGWMQFLPSTWRLYGVDANHDGVKDPYNPADAIFAAARYLRAAGAQHDLRKAIFSYNHASWYVDSVLLRARLIAGLPANLVGSLTGLTEGRFPVDARARYADQLSRLDIKRRRRTGNAANVVESGTHRSIDIYARRNAPVVAVNDGRIVRVGQNRRLGRYIVLQDVYGNTYTYARLGSVAKRYPSPKPQRVTQREIAKEMKLPPPDAPPTAPATETTRPAAHAPSKRTVRRATPKGHTHHRARTAPTKERLFAHPNRPRSAAAGGAQQEFERTGSLDGDPTVGGYLKRVFGLDRKDVRLRPLRKGAQVVAGTVIGHIGKTVPGKAPHLVFEIRPAGKNAPRIDPKPILDGWQLLQTTAIYRAAGQNPFVGKDAPTIGQILLMGKDELAQRVLADPRIQIYPCGRRDIQTGQIDRRVLATLEFLAASGFKPTVTSLKCGHSIMTVSGNVSEHSTGDAVDIGAVNGIPILGHQGPGSITQLVIQRLLTLQGTMKPHQIISLMTFPGADNTLSMPDHANHIHIGFRPMYGSNSKLGRQLAAILQPKQWTRLIDRLGQLAEPVVRSTPSRFATKVRPSPQPKPGD